MHPKGALKEMPLGCISCGAPLGWKNNQTGVLIKSSLCLLTAIFFLLVLVATASAASARAYKVKAGFVYSFSLFTQWPKDTFAKDPHNFHIGVVGKTPFGNTLDQAASRPVSGRKPVIHYFDTIPSPADLQKCQMIFITSSMARKTDKILKLISGFPVLTISDMGNFLEKGGMISLVTKRNRIKFAVNRKAARDAGIEFRSQMLKMALWVLER